MAIKATAERTSRMVTVEEPAITLTMGTQEAETLLLVLARLGGSPHNSRRGETDAIYKALDTAGVRNHMAESGNDITRFFQCTWPLFFKEGV